MGNSRPPAMSRDFQSNYVALLYRFGDVARIEISQFSHSLSVLCALLSVSTCNFTNF